MKVAGVYDDSISNGEGWRSVLFVSGCPHRCKGCHNSNTWQPDYGSPYNEEEIFEKLTENELLDGVTISGGEPFLYTETLLPLVKRIKEKGLNISLFTIRWPKHDILDCKHKLRMFVDEVLSELTEYQEKGASQEVLDQLFQEKVNDINILNCYADIDRCVLKALKPRNAQLAEMKEYFLWDEVSGWSNGEKHASRMAMFITLNTFIRKKRFSRGETWKFLIADNPFGEASADHVVKPMVVLARKTNTQLFCLTGIEDKRIQMEFDTVISNQYVEQRGRLFLHSETETKEQLELDSLFYSQQLKLNF
ncbi:MAG: radical SAM protein [Bacillaceae bacterium]|nr:radical SAM protein [Bacillaceae bacterium]